MDYDYCKRSGQIPAFGDWDYSNEMPITQYFECARQAGLIRYSSSSGDSDPYINGGCGAGADDLYAVDLKKPSRNIYNAPPRKTRVRSEKRGSQVKEQKKQAAGGKVFDVTDPPRKQPHHVPLSTTNINYSYNYNNKLHRNGVVPRPTTRRRPPSVRPPKAVDEDLYKIPPELLHSSNRKKMTGFFSCLVPACAS